MKNKIKVDVWYGTPFANCKVHAVILDEENKGHANLLCNNKRLQYQGLSAGLDFDEVSCIRCYKKLQTGNYEHADEFFVKDTKDKIINEIIIKEKELKQLEEEAIKERHPSSMVNPESLLKIVRDKLFNLKQELFVLNANQVQKGCGNKSTRLMPEQTCGKDDWTCDECLYGKGVQDE